MSFSKFSIALLFSLFAASTYSDTLQVQMQSAEKQVSEYQALRRACTMYKHEQKHACYKQLRSLTASYKQARRFLVTQAPVEDKIFVVSQ